MSVPTASGRNVRFALATLRADGQPVDVILKRAGIRPAVAADPDARLSHTALLGFWDAALEVTGDPYLGLHLGARVRPAGFDALGYAFWASASFGEGLARLARYHRFMDDAVLFAVETEGRRVRITMAYATPSAVSRPLSEFQLAAVTHSARRETGDRRLDPAAVEFGFARPEHTSEYERFFRAPVRFGRANNALVYPHAALQRPFQHAEPELLEVLERRVSDVIGRLPRFESLAAGTRAALGQHLASGRLSIAEVSRGLGVSERSLHRRLQAEGTTFRELLAQVRHELAERYLRAGTPLTETAFLLGYSEASAFHRAFKQRTGRTPADYRREFDAS